MVFKDIQQIVQHPQHIQLNISFSRYRGATVLKVHTCNLQAFYSTVTIQSRARAMANGLVDVFFPDDSLTQIGEREVL